MLDGRREAHATVGRLVEGELKGAEEPSRAWDGDGDEPEFSEDLLPALTGDALFAPELVKELGQLDIAVGRQLDGLADGVDEPDRKSVV